jgi:hypothetical protein
MNAAIGQLYILPFPGRNAPQVVKKKHRRLGGRWRMPAIFSSQVMATM